ncbi:MAG: acyl-CoA dehydrogenase family protein, partial [bacterium]|nr:acyl-CoA dehydrogenase family protein [bacterium]
MTAAADLSEFRTRVRYFLATHAATHGWLRDATSRRESFRPYADAAGAEETILRRAVECQRMLFEAGLAGITWPTEYGGQGLSRREQIVFNEELGQFELPLWPYTITFGMCGPTVLSAGTDPQKQRYL